MSLSDYVQDIAFDKHIFKAHHDAVKAASATYTLNAWASVRISKEIDSRHKLLSEIITTYMVENPWLPRDHEVAECLENPSAWQSAIDDLSLDDRSVLASYLDALDSWFYVDAAKSDVDSFRLDSNNTIDRALPIDTAAWSKYISANPAYKVREHHNCSLIPASKDKVSQMLVKGTYGQRKAMQIQRLLNAVDVANEKGWFIVFDTLTLAEDKVNDFYETDNALRDHFRSVGRLISRSDLYERGGRSSRANITVAAVDANIKDCFSYFCVPEYGSAKGRLHFHALYFMRTLPSGTQDPNLNRSKRIAREVQSLKGLWSFGMNQPISVRYSGDAFSTRARWLWPIDKKSGKAIVAGNCRAVAFYVSKYISKQSNELVNAKGLNGDLEWSSKISMYIRNHSKQFRVRMSRGFGLEMPSMSELTLNSLREMCKLSWMDYEKTKLLKHCARRELKSRLAKLSFADIPNVQPQTINLLAYLRNLILENGEFNLQNFIHTIQPLLRSTDVSDETNDWLKKHKLTSADRPITRQSFGGK